jgi:sec-independent protein translocase protein TatA
LQLVIDVLSKQSQFITRKNRLEQPKQKGNLLMHFSTDLLFVNLGVPELSIIVVLVLILFGPGKLPHVMKSLGDGVKSFKDAASGKTEDSGTDTKKVE